MNTALALQAGFEYFWQKEADASGSNFEDMLKVEPDDFSLHGHRLPSLYRTFKHGQFDLNFRYWLISFCQKYSLPNASSRKAA